MRKANRMKRTALLLLGLAGLTLTGCARPGEFGYTTVLTPEERSQAIARNWDWEGKQVVDDIDHLLLLRPTSHLTEWQLR